MGRQLPLLVEQWLAHSQRHKFRPALGLVFYQHQHHRRGNFDAARHVSYT